MKSPYPAPIQEAIENLNRKRIEIAKLTGAYGFAERAVADEQFKDLNPSMTLSTWSMPQVQITIHPTSMKQVAQFLRLFAKNGYRQSSMQDHTTLHEIDYDLNGGVRVSARFQKQDGGEEVAATCRYVKVGETTEVVTKPIYELQCDD